MAGHMQSILDSLNDREKLPRVECPEPVDGLFWVYIVQCSNRTLYVGHTGNLPQRVKYHETGVGARHTKLLAPIHLVYTEGPMTSAKQSSVSVSLKSGRDQKRARSFKVISKT